MEDLQNKRAHTFIVSGYFTVLSDKPKNAIADIEALIEDGMFPFEDVGYTFVKSRPLNSTDIKAITELIENYDNE